MNKTKVVRKNENESKDNKDCCNAIGINSFDNTFGYSIVNKL